MNYHDAVERTNPDGTPSGRFDMTTTNDGQVRPIGYCHPFPYADWTEADVVSYVNHLYGEPEPGHPGFADAQERHAELVAETQAMIARYASHRDQYHDDGHATAEEAFACYWRYLLDNCLVLDAGVFYRAAYKCMAPGCGRLTNRKTTVRSRVWTLCDEHRTRAMVELLWPRIGPSMGTE